MEYDLLVGSFCYDKHGRRIDVRQEFVVDADGNRKQVGITEVVRHPPQVLQFSRLPHPLDWVIDPENDF
jgi:hypothetical protein